MAKSNEPTTLRDLEKEAVAEIKIKEIEKRKGDIQLKYKEMTAAKKIYMRLKREYDELLDEEI